MVIIRLIYSNIHMQCNTLVIQCKTHCYHTPGKFGDEKVWRICSFWVFGKKTFGKLVNQPLIVYYTVYIVIYLFNPKLAAIYVGIPIMTKVATLK